MGKKSTIFLKLAQADKGAQNRKLLVTVAVVLILITTLFFVKKNIDRHLARTLDKYESEVTVYKDRKQSIASEIDTLDQLYSQVDKKMQALEKSVGAIKTSTSLITVDSTKLQKVTDSLSLAYLTTYSDTLSGFVEEFAKKVEKRGNLFKDVPVIPPIPLSEVFTTERGYGTFKDPFTSRMTKHNGLDFAAETGTKVIATANGVVKSAEEHRFWGKRIVLRHKNSFQTVYAHLATMNVKPGQRVKKGQTIGSVGESGLTTGPHVHYELYHKGSAIDPMKYLMLEGLK